MWECCAACCRRVNGAQRARLVVVLEEDARARPRVHRRPDSAVKALLHILTSHQAGWPDFALLAAYERLDFCQKVRAPNSRMTCQH